MNGNRRLFGEATLTRPTSFDDDDELPTETTTETTPSSTAADDGKLTESSGGNAAVVTLTPELTAYSPGDSLDVLVTLSANSGDVPQGTLDTRKRPGVDLVAVIDVSGSMQGAGKIENAILTAKFIVESMGANDRVAIVCFSSQAWRLLKLTKMTDSSKVKALNLADGIKANGGTDILAAVDLGLAHLSGRKYKNSVCGMLLLTDGQDSTTISGIRDVLEIHGMAGTVPIHTMAFGVDHKAELLRQIAEETLGTYSFIENAESVSDAVAPALAGMLSIVSKSTSISVFGEGISFSRVESGAYKSKIEEGKTFIQAGDCYDGEHRKFLLTVKLEMLPAHLSAEYSYTDPIADKVKSGSAHLAMESSSGPDEAKNNAEVTEFKLNLMFKNALKSALALTAAGKYSAARTAMEEVLKSVQEYPYTIPEDTKAGLIGEINNNLEKMVELEKRGAVDLSYTRTVVADMNASSAEMEVQRAGLNAMQKSAFNRTKYSTKTQDQVSVKASEYWSTNSKK